MSLYKTFSNIDWCIKNAEFDTAIEELNLLKPIIIENFSALSEIDKIKPGDERTDRAVVLVLNYCGFLISCGDIKKDKSVIEEGMSYAQSVFSKLSSDHSLYSSYGYNLANGYSSLYEIKQNFHEQFFIGDKQTEEAKQLYRTILTNIDSCNKLILSILTNYANLLNGRLGRSIEALHVFDRALDIEPKFSMALANKGYVQNLLASVTDGEAKKVLLHEAYINIKKAINLGLEVGPRQYFEGIIENNIKKIFPDISSLGENIECSITLSDEGDFKSYYKKFCVSHGLYLNPISKSHQCAAATYDPLIITKMLVEKSQLNKLYKFSGYFNQIKQEYVFARYLTAQSFYQDPSIKFIDEDVVLLNTLEYSAHSIFLEQARTAFRVSYSILDKIAFFMNEYLDLGFPENRIYFYLFSPLHRKNKLEKLYPIQNPYLAAILDLATDFTNGHFEKISKLRNALEHRFKSVHIFDIPQNDVEEENINKMTTKEFRELLVEFLVIVKSAIFYLALFIDWEEKKKVKEKGDHKLVPIRLHELKDELKGG